MSVATAGSAAAVFVAAIALLWYTHPDGPSSGMSTSTPPVGGSGSGLIKTTPGIDTWYTNEALHFSFRIPDGFTAQDIKINLPRAHEALLHNSGDDGLLVVVLPIAQGSTRPLTEAGLRANAPNQYISNVEPGVIGLLVEGLSFHTDAKVWGGDGVGFWFVHDGYLYELNTFARDQALLDFVRTTWVFGSPTLPPPPVRRSS